VARTVEIEFFADGTLILEQGGATARAVYVVRTGAVELVADGGVLDVLGPGEMFGHPSLVSGLPPSFSVRAREDTLCFLLDPDAAERVLRTGAGLTFLSRSLRERTMRALEGSRTQRADPWRARVGTIVKRAPVMCEATVPVREAAELMARERISSVLVTSIEGSLGILTDRDLRSRVLAAGRSPAVPISEVASIPAVTVGEGSLLSEVLQSMLEHGVHHLPVVDADGHVLGVVTDTDLMGLERTTPFALKSQIQRAGSTIEVVEVGRELPRMVLELVDAAVDPVDVGHVVGVTIDALTSRMLELAIEDMGEPPVPWAWLSLGSQARHEQALSTDQDHALAYDLQDRDPTDTEIYFAKLAEAVTSGIEAAGIPRCKAGVTATEESWRGSTERWLDRFRGWVTDLTVDGSVLTAIAFDFRRIGGSLPVEDALRDIVAAAPRLPIFLRHMARNATALRPPTGFLHDFVVEAKGEHAGKLDVKHRGITLVTSIARTYGLAVGSTKIGTLERLRDAASAGRLSEDDRTGLEESFRLLWQVRLEHQCQALKAGSAPDDFVDPKELGPITRQGLKAAFRMIDGVERGMVAEFGLSVR
jgi:CBS domain-containing protein